MNKNMEPSTMMQKANDLNAKSLEEIKVGRIATYLRDIERYEHEIVVSKKNIQKTMDAKTTAELND